MQIPSLRLALPLSAALLLGGAAGSRVLPAAPAPSIFPSAPPVCSKRVLTEARTREYLLVEATEDTVLAGSGRVEIATGPMERGTRPVPDTVVIRGQLVDVEALVGADSVAELARERGAILVPWAYAPDCRPLVWGGSARWIEPGLRGVVEGSLRTRDEWAGEVPTFDVHHPYPWPYPHSGHWSRRSQGPLLTADAFLAFVERLPTYGRADDPEAYGDLLAWARAHPELADREPAGSVIRRLRSAPYEEAVRRLEVPFAGTWRLRVGFGAREAVRWIRTASRPGGAWTPPGTGWDREGPFGFAIEAHTKDDVEDLPEAGGRGEPRSRGQLAVTHPPEARGDSLVWEAWLPAPMLDRALRAEGWGREWLVPAVRRPPDWISYVPVRIVRAPDGRISSTSSWRAPSGERAFIELERVSDVATSPR